MLVNMGNSAFEHSRTAQEKAMSTVLVSSEYFQKCLAAEELVVEQAEDEGLWFEAQTAPEAYIQEALRKLHRLIEGEDDGNPF